ncbi:MAG: hypothetical protein KDA80_11715, partial [Planctomycetaceae bacterium]|nr:hypothetical protein [Planctomycetaceae bacterium]
RRLLISSQTKWLRLGAVLGVGALIFGVLISLFKLTQWLVDPQFVMVPGWISLFLGLMFFGGLNSLFLSIILEYLGVLVSRSLGKPTYFIVDRSSDKILLQAFEMDREREKALVTT